MTHSDQILRSKLAQDDVDGNFFEDTVKQVIAQSKGALLKYKMILERQSKVFIVWGPAFGQLEILTRASIRDGQTKQIIGPSLTVIYTNDGHGRPLGIVTMESDDVAKLRTEPKAVAREILKKVNLLQASRVLASQDAALRSNLIRLANEKPELRVHLIPLLRVEASAKTSKLQSRQEAILKKYLEGGGNAMSFDDLPSATVKALEAVKDQETLWSDVERWLGDNNNPHLKSKWATQQKVAHKAILFSEGLDKTAVRDGQAFMVYKVDPIDNNSKFYEGLIIEEDSNPGNPQSEVSGFRVLRRWGALTDSGQTGRIDGAKYDEMDDYWFPTLNGAKMELRKHYMKRLTNGYKSAFGDEHTTPDGHKLPMGEYPVGLTRKPGFGWGSQSITNCSPALHNLQEALANARKEIITTGKASAVQEDLMRAVQILKTVASADSTMATKILKAVNLVLRRLSGSPRFLPDEDGKALAGNLKTIQTYVGKQLSLCNEG